MKTIARILLATIAVWMLLCAALDFSGLQLVVGLYTNGVGLSIDRAAQAHWFWAVLEMATGFAAAAGLGILSRGKNGVPWDDVVDACRRAGVTCYMRETADKKAELIIDSPRTYYDAASVKLDVVGKAEAIAAALNKPPTIGQRDNGDPSRKSPGA